MKFFTDFLIVLTGFILFVSSLLTIFAIIGYFQGASSADTLWALKLTVPVMVITFVIGWWRRDVFSAVLGWMFP